MHLTSSGTGHTIVFLHGFCESSAIWKRLSLSLAKSYQIICIDLPGHGKSATPDKEFSLEEVAQEIQATLAQKKIDSYFMIGHSLGGYITLALAELFPDKLLGFGLFHSSTFADDENKKVMRDKVGKYIMKYGMHDFARTFVPGLFAEHSKLRYALAIEELIEEASQTSPSGAAYFSMAIKNRPDRTTVLSKFPKPVFVIGGDQDPAVSLRQTEQMINQIRIGDHLILKNTGHHGFLEAEKESLDFLKAFFEKFLAH